eukprot:sb/3462144/
MSLEMWQKLTISIGLPEIVGKADLSFGGAMAACKSTHHQPRTFYLITIVVAVLHQLKEQAGEADRHTNAYSWWTLVYNYGILILVLYQATRSADFHLYRAALEAILPYCFQLDRVNYKVWLTVHVGDLFQIEESNPAIYQEFLKGNFTSCVSGRPFSSIALDQAHEHQNRDLKKFCGNLASSEGVVWHLAVPIIKERLLEYERKHELPGEDDDDDEELLRHDDSEATIKAFEKDCSAVAKAISVGGRNIFQDGQIRFLTDGKVIPGEEECATEILALVENGTVELEKFRRERLEECTVPVNATMTMTMMKMPGEQRASRPGPVAGRRGVVSEMALIQQVVRVMDRRPELTLDTLFKEPGRVCAAFSKASGEPYWAPCKSTLMTFFEKRDTSYIVTPAVAYSSKGAVIVDLSGIVVNLGVRSRSFATFGAFFDAVFTRIINTGKNNTLFHIAVDNYLDPNPLKELARENRGKGTAIQINSSTPFPKTFITDFLKNSSNKKELYSLLIKHLIDLATAQGKQIVAAGPRDVQVSSTAATSLTSLRHLEADTRVIAHALDILANYPLIDRITFLSTDTDVFVLVLAWCRRMKDSTVHDLGVYLDTGKKRWDMSAVLLKEGETVAAALPYVHAVSGADWVPAFYGHGKTAFLEALISSSPRDLMIFGRVNTDQSLSQLGELCAATLNLVKSVYKVDSCATLAEARLLLLRKKVISSFRLLPPSPDALRQQCLRALFTTAFYWGGAGQSEIYLPPYNDYGWKESEDSVEVRYLASEDGAEAYQGLLKKCKCTTGCKKRCGCKDLGCWALCSCEGSCGEEGGRQ